MLNAKLAVQEFTATTLLKLVYSSSLDSKLFTTLPVVSHPFLIEPAKILEISAGKNGLWRIIMLYNLT